MSSDLELARLGLRFASRETEASYRHWHAREAMQFMRVTYAASILVVFPAALVVGWFAAPYAFWRFAPWVLFVLEPALIVGLVCTYRPWMSRWMGPTSVVMNAGSVCVFVILTLEVMHRADLAMASTVIGSFIAFAWLRLHLGEAILAVLPYIAIDEILMARSQEPLGIVIAYSSLNLIALVTGSLVAWTIGRTSRESYRQARTIEEQQRVIQRERDRADSLRENELARVNEEVRRQVAERSRELSEALAKLSPTALAIAADRVIDGRYRVVRKLGVGGMVAVYEVERAGDKRHLALKTLRSRGNPETLARLAREAQIAAQLSHPNLVPVIDVGIADGVLFVVMPLIPGGSLEQQRTRFGDANWATPLLAAIASGLAALHERGIIHRDLKPGNILLADGIPQIADFGLASVSVDAVGDTLASSEAHADTAAPLTRAGDVMGTPAYMAPELAAGASAASPASDVFAFGVMAYEMMRGRAPFAEPIVFARSEGRRVKTPTFDGVAAAIMLSLDLDPAKRPSALALATALSSA